MITKIIEAPDLFATNGVYYPPEFRDTEIRDRQVRAISFETRRDSFQTPFVEATQQCLNHLCRYLPCSTIVKVFCAQDCFVTDSATYRAKGLWRSSEVFKKVRASAVNVGPELANRTGSEVRHYGLCEVTLGNSLEALEAIRLTESCFGLLGHGQAIDDTDLAETCYQSAFGNRSTSVDWTRLIQQMTNGDHMLVRVTGRFDDRDVAIDLFNVPPSIAI